MDDTVRALIEHYGMTQLPVEGTYFVSTYRSVADTATVAGSGPVGTAMIGLYAAEPPSRSLFHRLAFDEVWHFYGGDPIRLVLLHPDGTSSEVTLGSDVLDGQSVQHMIPAGTWQAGELAAGGAWALFGCTMAPGFTGDCFEGGTVGALIASHPDRADDIHRLAVPDDHDTTMPDGFAT
jgi:predicted cupin superfamily sugar epimerase